MVGWLKVFVLFIFVAVAYSEESTTTRTKIKRRKVKKHSSDDILISVVIPTYGTEKEIVERAIMSVVSQRETFGGAVEIIVVNDGHSVEYSKEISESYVTSNGYPLTFVNNIRNGGLGCARNYGIERARGMWILPLDSDDELHPKYIISAVEELKKRGASLHNPEFTNVIMPYMSDGKGNPLSWQPSADVAVITDHNVFHCCGMFLRAIWDHGIRYDETLVLGWEDWDFWIRLNHEIGIQPVIVSTPLYVYHKADEVGDYMSSFCTTYFSFCKAILHFNNPCIYGLEDLLSLASVLIEHASVLEGHKKWNTILFQAKIGDPLAIFLESVVENSKVPIGASATPLQIRGVEGDIRDYFEGACADKCAGVYNDLLSDKGHKFHVSITKKPRNPVWVKVARHMLVALLKLHPNSKVYLHTDYPTVLSKRFYRYFGGRLKAMPLCMSSLAADHGYKSVDNYIRRYAAGRPFGYSHITDYYRYLLLYVFGGTYMDTDIIVRKPVDTLTNSVARESEHWVNGAFMAFEKQSKVMKYCLDLIPKVYSPYAWGTIGPNLVTNSSKTFLAPDLNVLPIATFYSIHWNQYWNLSSVDVTDHEYETARNVYGYHLWSKLMLADGKPVVFSNRSVGGRALKEACIPEIMECLL